MSKEDNIRLMEKMIPVMRNSHPDFEIMSDEEFYNSPYGEARRKRGPRKENEIYFHCLVPGSSENLISGYYTNGKIRFPINSDYAKFDTRAKAAFVFKKNRYWEASVESADEDILYHEGLLLVEDFLNHFRALNSKTESTDYHAKDNVIPTYYIERTLNKEKNVLLVKDKKGNLFVQKSYDVFGIEDIDKLASLKIDNMPRIEKIQKMDNRVFTIEEYIEGITLEELRDKENIIAEDKIVDITLKLCNILKGLHSQNPPIIHRDIKPSNIIINSEGDIYLIDFNAMKEVHDNQNEDTILIGTKNYAAPEQISGYGQSDARTDIFGIGATMNYLMCGMHPHQMIAPGIYGEVWKKCTRLEKKDRYQSVEELAYVLITRSQINSHD